MISINHVLEMSRLSDEWMQDLLSREPADTWARIAHDFAHLVRCRCAALLLTPDDDPDRLVVRGLWPGNAERCPVVSRAITDVFPAAQQGEKVVPFLVHTTPGGSPPPLEASLADSCSHALRLPLLKRRRWVIGAVLLIGRDGGFADDEIQLATLLATKAALAAEHLRSFVMRRDLLEEIHEARTGEQVLSAILRMGMRMVRAHRGDLACCDSTGNLLYTAQYRAERSREGEPVPADGVIRWVWDHRRPRRIDDVGLPGKYVRGYHPCDPRVRSELAVLLERQGRAIGVLNAESFHVCGFDEQDEKTLERLARTAATAYLLVNQQATLARITRTLTHRPGEVGGTAPVPVLKAFLELIRTIHGIDCGLIYLPDYSRGTLCGAALMGYPEHDLHTDPFEYRFAETAAATRAFNTRESYYSADPARDPAVNQDGRWKFGIVGPVVAVPMCFLDEVVGVMVLWSRQGPPPRPEHADLLLPLARTGALFIHEGEYEQRRHVFQSEVEEVLTQMQTMVSLEKNLDRIIRAITRLGFDRTRIYRFETEDRFRGVACGGMGERTDWFRTQFVQTIDHPYAGQVVKTYESNPRARVYPEPGRPDPDAELLGKTRDEKGNELPWADVPLVSAFKLYGMLTVDNAHSRRPFTKEDLDYLTLFGTLAARAFAIDDRQRRSGPDLGKLYRKVAAEPDLGVVIRCVLRYLTHGQGMGFSRGLFLTADARGQATFTEGVGSATRERWVRIAGQTRHVSLDEVIGRAGGEIDEQLCTRLRHLRIPRAEAWWRFEGPDRRLSRRFGVNGEMPAWMQQLADLIDMPEALAVPVFSTSEEERCQGVLIVDRRWQRSDRLNDADRTDLETFARDVGHILTQHELVRRLLENNDAANLGMLTQGLTHELWHPLGNFRRDLTTLADALADGDEVLAGECQSALFATLGRMSQTVDRLAEMARPREALRPVVVADLINAVTQEIAPVLRSYPIDFMVYVEPRLPPVRGLAGPLHVALHNLILNAENALLAAKTPERFIHLAAQREGDWLVLMVVDNGPGLSPQEMRRLEGPGSAFTSRRTSQRGLGLGLAIVKRVAYLHDGRFRLSSQPGLGVTARLYVPLAPRSNPHVAEDPHRR